MNRFFRYLDLAKLSNCRIVTIHTAECHALFVGINCSKKIKFRV
jgi:hypothetical protein